MLTTPANADQNYASDLKDEISALFKKKKPVEVDLGGTERLSLACAQVLIAARRKARKQGSDINIIPSDAVRNVLEETGLSDILFGDGEGRS